MPIQDHFGRFAMRLETMSQEQKWIDVDSIGEGLGLSSHDSRQLADMLSEEGWITFLQGPDGILKVKMTKHGFEGVAKLRLPAWRQWLDKHPSVKTAMIGAGFAILGSLITTLLTHLLLSPH